MIDPLGNALGPGLLRIDLGIHSDLETSFWEEALAGLGIDHTINFKSSLKWNLFASQMSLADSLTENGLRT